MNDAKYKCPTCGVEGTAYTCGAEYWRYACVKNINHPTWKVR